MLGSLWIFTTVPTSGGQSWTPGSCRLRRGDDRRRPGASGGGVAARRVEGWRRDASGGGVAAPREEG
jgi:hypothetical protein